MIGLGKVQARTYEAIKRLNASSFVPPRDRTVSKAIGKKFWATTVIINRLCEMGFVVRDKTGRAVALDPPHERVMEEVLHRSTATREQIVGPSKEVRLMGPRRVIAKMLRNDFGYTYRTIGKVLNRSHRTVEDYFTPNKCAIRAAYRKRKYEAARASR